MYCENNLYMFKQSMQYIDNLLSNNTYFNHR